MAAGVDVPRVDGAREARRGAEARRAVRAARQPLQLRQLDHVGAVGAHAVLAVLLGPVERAVGQPDQLVALAGVLRRGRDPGADRDRADRLEVERADPVDDRRRATARAALSSSPGSRTANSSPPSRKASPPWRSRAASCDEHAVAGRMAEAVVDPLEVVDVDEAEAERQTPSCAYSRARARAARGSGGGCRGRSAGRSARAASRGAREDRALVELDREQWPDERHREDGERCQSTTSISAAERHQRERDDRPADVRAREPEERAARAHRDHGGDQDQVDRY